MPLSTVMFLLLSLRKSYSSSPCRKVGKKKKKKKKLSSFPGKIAVLQMQTENRREVQTNERAMMKRAAETG